MAPLLSPPSPTGLPLDVVLVGGLLLHAVLVAASCQLVAGKVQVPVQSAHSLVLTPLRDLDEVALKPGCISRTLSPVTNLHILSSIQLDGLNLVEELLNFLNKVHCLN